MRLLKIIASSLLVLILLLVALLWYKYAHTTADKTEGTQPATTAEKVERITSDVYLLGQSLKGMSKLDFDRFIASNANYQKMMPVTLPLTGLEKEQAELTERAKVHLQKLANEAEHNAEKAAKGEENKLVNNASKQDQADGVYQKGLNKEKTIDEQASEYALALAIEPANIELDFANDAIYQEALQYKRTQKIELTPKLTFNQELLKQEIKRLAKQCNRDSSKPQVTGFDLASKTFLFDEGMAGRELKQDELYQAISTQLQKGDLKTQIKLPFKQVPVTASSAEMNQGLGLVSTATTYLPYSAEARNNNVRLGTQRINGTVIQPHDTYSLLQQINPMTEENGYMPAAVEIEDRVEQGIGGGLCQVSSTLFQAAAKANLDFVEYHNHGLVSAYCDPGMDAMIEDWADLILSNPTDYPYAICAEMNGNEVTYSIYGPANPQGATIDLEVEHLGYVEPEVQEKVDPNLAPGERKLIKQGISGQQTRTWRIYYVDGVEVDREAIVTGYYQDYPTVYAVGK